MNLTVLMFFVVLKINMSNLVYLFLCHDKSANMQLYVFLHRALGLSIKPAHLSSTASLQHNTGPRHTIDAILGLGSRTSPTAHLQDNSARNENESSGELTIIVYEIKIVRYKTVRKNNLDKT